MDTLKELKALGRRYLKTQKTADTYQEELSMLIWKAQEEGISISEIARVSGLSRPKVHYILTRLERKYGPARNTRVREWLTSHGYQVSPIGDIPASLVKDYEFAHEEEAQ